MTVTVFVWRDMLSTPLPPHMHRHAMHVCMSRHTTYMQPQWWFLPTLFEHIHTHVHLHAQASHPCSQLRRLAVSGGQGFQILLVEGCHDELLSSREPNTSTIVPSHSPFQAVTGFPSLFPQPPTSCICSLWSCSSVPHMYLPTTRGVLSVVLKA